MILWLEDPLLLDLEAGFWYIAEDSYEERDLSRGVELHDTFQQDHEEYHALIAH